MSDEILNALGELKAGQDRIEGRLGRVEADLGQLKKTLDLQYTATTIWRSGVTDHLELIAEQLGASKKKARA